MSTNNKVKDPVGKLFNGLQQCVRCALDENVSAFAVLGVMQAISGDLANTLIRQVPKENEK